MEVAPSVKAFGLCSIAYVVGMLCGSSFPVATSQDIQPTPLAGTPTSMKRVRSDFDLRLTELLKVQKEAREHDGQVSTTLDDHTERLERIEESTKQPEPVADIVEPPNEPAVQRAIVRLYTADSSWQCAACDQQKAKLKANPPAFEYETILGSGSNNTSPTKKYPAWEVIRPDGSRSLKSGQFATSTLNAWVNGQPQTSTQSGRYSIAELRQWIQQHYHPTSSLMADVRPQSAVWTHLQDNNHGFTGSQVRGLQHWEAMALHDAHHRGRITPFRGSAKAVRLKRARIAERPSYAYWSAI